MRWNIQQDMKNYVGEAIKKQGIWETIRKMTQKPDATTVIAFSPMLINEHFAAISNKPIVNDVPIPTMEFNSDKYKLSVITMAELQYAWRKMNKKENKSEDGLGMSNIVFNKF